MRRLGFALALLVACGGSSQAEQAAGSSAVVVFPDATRVRVDVADTEPLRQRGLMFREGLGPTEGMLFVFDTLGHYPFWMQNMLIPLDMLWLDADATVVAIANSVPPCRADPCPTYPPGADALYVVEVMSGFVKAHDVQVGDVLTLVGAP